MITKDWYVADFETTDYKYYEENGITKVWLYGICDNNCNIISFGYSIEDFMNVIERRLNKKTIYFHNLKFDGTFILDYLLNNGFTYVNQIETKPKTFSVLIGDTGAWYSMDICFNKGKTIHIVDSLKLLPFKVEKIAEDFGLPIIKEKIDYSNYTITPMTLIYQLHDCKIVAMALNQIKNEGMTKLTTASCAYNNYKDMNTDMWFDIHYPELSTDFLCEWRKAYRGGRCQVSPLFKGKILNNVRRYDINSMYPSIMYECSLPYGEPIECTITGQYKFELYLVRIDFELRDDCMPSLLRKGALFGSEDTYYIETDGIELLYISNIDLDLVKRNYNVYYLEYIKIYGFKTSTNMFKEYIDLWYSRKCVDKGAKKIVDKLMLNSLYGKFGSNCKGAHKIPFISEEVVALKNSDIEDMKKYYLPMAIAIVSYAHLKIDNGIHKAGYDKFVYVDTDSIHTLGTLPNELIDQKKLGYYKLEGIEETSKYLRQKAYVYKQDNKISITCAGMPNKLKENAIKEYGDNIFKAFDVGFSIGGKLLPKRVKGGTVLYETDFTIM